MFQTSTSNAVKTQLAREQACGDIPLLTTGGKKHLYLYVTLSSIQFPFSFPFDSPFTPIYPYMMPVHTGSTALLESLNYLPKPYSEGQGGELVSRLKNPISHIITPVIPIIKHC